MFRFRRALALTAVSSARAQCVWRRRRTVRRTAPATSTAPTRAPPADSTTRQRRRRRPHRSTRRRRRGRRADQDRQPRRQLDRDAVRDRRRRPGDRRRRRRATTRPRPSPRRPTCPGTSPTSRRSPRTSPTWSSTTARPTSAASSTRSGIPHCARRRARGLRRRLRADRAARAQSPATLPRPPSWSAQMQTDIDAAIADDRRTRGAADLLPRARQHLLQRQLEHVHRPGVRAVRPAQHRRHGRGRPRTTRS